LREAPALAVFDAIASGHRRFSFTPWRMISFGQWMEAFDVGA
jgi:hypothetical protein